MADEVVVRTYTGQGQGDAALMYAEDAPKMAVDGWVPVSQVWVAGEWPTSMWLLSSVLVLVGIGILMLFALALVKPTRTLLVTYGRSTPGVAGTA
jgi:hypothetical protein